MFGRGLEPATPHNQKTGDLLEGVAQQEADLAAVVALFAITQVALRPVELRLDLADAGHLLLLLGMEVGTGELVSHGLGPGHQSSEGEY